AVARFDPALLAGGYRGGHWWSAGSGGYLAAAALATSLLLTFAIPVVVFTVASRLGEIQEPARGDSRARGFAHMAFAAPPLFTFVGVVTYLLGYPSGDYAFWPIIWITAIVAVWVCASRTDVPTHPFP